MSSVAQSSRHICVRSAHQDDLDALLELWKELMALHEHPDGVFSLAHDAASTWRRGVKDLLDRDDSFVWVAHRDDGRLLGFCSGWVAKNPAIYALRDVGFLCDMVVGQAHRRQGIGRMLMAKARAWFGRRALEEFQLSSAVWNEEAHHFWRAVGGAPLLLRFRFALEDEAWPEAQFANGADASRPERFPIATASVSPLPEAGMLTK